MHEQTVLLPSFPRAPLQPAVPEMVSSAAAAISFVRDVDSKSAVAGSRTLDFHRAYVEPSLAPGLPFIYVLAQSTDLSP